MIWLIMFGLLFGLGLMFIKEDGCFLLLVVALLGCGAIIGKGLVVYPDLVDSKARAEALQSEIESMRGARYKAEAGQLVGGSLDNIKQSTALSEYISNYAECKANYNSDLAGIKAIMKIKTYWWFSNTAFISQEVLDLEAL